MDKLNSSINIFGLAVGMAAVILISLYVQHELSYDKFNLKHERIYRLLSSSDFSNQKETIYPYCLRLTADNFASEIPEIEHIAQMYRGHHQNVKVDNKEFSGIKCQYVDTNIHKVLSLKAILKKSTSLFSDPETVVLNESTAEKLFGSTQALGKELEIFGRKLTVSSVVEDLPANSHYKFDLLLPLTSFEWESNQKSLEYFTYILLKKNIDRKSALNKINAKHAQVLEERFGSYGSKTASKVQKLTDIYLKSSYGNYQEPLGNIRDIYVYILLAILILLIAIINFINIITIRYEGKLSEIGIHKTVGASRFDLFRQFLGRSMLLSACALILAVILSEVFLSNFSILMNKELKLQYQTNPLLYAGLPSLTIIVGLLSGIYPALAITKHSPVNILKGGLLAQKNVSLSKVLLIFQFAVSMILIIALSILHQQVKFVKEADLGFDPEKVIAISNLSKKQKHSYLSIKQELLKNPNIVDVCASTHLPGGGVSGQFISLADKSQEESKTINEYRVTPDYFKTLGIEFKLGEDFNEYTEADDSTIILNEKALKYLEIDDALGKEVMFHGKKHTIKGVVKDFHYSSLKEKIAPLMFSKTYYLQFFIIKTRSQNFDQIIPEIKETFNRFDPERMNYHKLVNEVCRDRYQKEERAELLISYSSILSILLALLGLYALSLFMVQKRTKEIGIRKVNGASVWQITSLLFSAFSKWLGIAYIVAVPIGYFIMKNWLEQFAYRVDIGPLPFLAAGFVTAFFALATVGRQTWKAANQNPVKSLRYE
jgi:putative ABC transport system permease protein